jgi:hypothetical protein
MPNPLRCFWGRQQEKEPGLHETDDTLRFNAMLTPVYQGHRHMHLDAYLWNKDFGIGMSLAKLPECREWPSTHLSRQHISIGIPITIVNLYAVTCKGGTSDPPVCWWLTMLNVCQQPWGRGVNIGMCRWHIPHSFTLMLLFPMFYYVCIWFFASYFYFEVIYHLKWHNIKG